MTRADKTNLVTLGEITGKAEGDALALTFKLELHGLKMDAAEADALAAARNLARKLLTMAAESTGRSIQAIFFAHIKGDGAGAAALQAHFIRAHRALSLITGNAIKGLAQAGVAFPTLDVSKVVPPSEPGVPHTFERVEGILPPPGPRLITEV